MSARAARGWPRSRRRPPRLATCATNITAMSASRGCRPGTGASLGSRSKENTTARLIPGLGARRAAGADYDSGDAWPGSGPGADELLAKLHTLHLTIDPPTPPT